jgi:DNA modification methylase
MTTTDPSPLHQNRIYQLDCLEGLGRLKNGSVDLLFTSPPYYNAKEYAEYASYGVYLDFMEDVFREARRVLSEGRFFVLNTSPVLEPRSCRSDQSTRYAIPFDLHPRVTGAGFSFIDDIIWAKPEPSAKNRNAGFNMHRKPLAYKANSVAEYVMVYRSATDRLIDWNIKQCGEEVVEESLVRGEYERSNLWRINPDTSSEHPAPFPEALAERVISYYSVVGDLVLDPFAGSGTTAAVSKQLGRRWLGFERSAEYCEMARARVRRASRFFKMDRFFS